MFHDAPAVLRKELKALRLKVEQKRALVQRYGLRFFILYIVIWGEIQDSKLLIFWFAIFSDLVSLR